MKLGQAMSHVWGTNYKPASYKLASVYMPKSMHVVWLQLH